ncbi:MAG: tetratricopeptide repeat protein [Thermomicrobiales bacterium]
MDGPAQALFRSLTVFVGGFTLDAVVAVASPDGDPHTALTRFEDLVHQSLVQRMPIADEPRFVILETIRAFGLEQLCKQGELGRAQDAHAAYVLTFTEAPLARLEAGARTMVNRAATERDNIRAAIAHCIATGQGDAALRLAGLFAWYVQLSFHEARSWLAWALAHTAAEPSAPRALALAELAAIHWAQGEYDQASPLAESALAIAKSVHDLEATAHALHSLGLIANETGRLCACARDPATGGRRLAFAG